MLWQQQNQEQSVEFLMHCPCPAFCSLLYYGQYTSQGQGVFNEGKSALVQHNHMLTSSKQDLPMFSSVLWAFWQLCDGIYLPHDCDVEWFPFLSILLLVLTVMDIVIVFQIILLEPSESHVVSSLLGLDFHSLCLFYHSIKSIYFTV